jgi:Concanavalin A-like lectin/glucanases superfamily
MKAKLQLLLTLGVVTFASVIAGMAQGPPPPPGAPCCWPPISAAKKLVNVWHFGEPAGTTSADFAGSVNNIGVDHGAIPRAGGVLSRSLQLQGAQWMQVANNNEVNFLGTCSSNNAESGTIAFWISTTSGAGVKTIIEKRETTSSNFLRGYSIFLWNGRLGFQMATGTGNQLCNTAGSACSNFIATSLPSIADGNWHFVAISFSRCNSPTALFYVDGAIAPFTPRVGDLSNSSDLLVGRLAPALGTSYFTGQLDELMYFKFAYSKADLDVLRNDKCQTKCWM